MTGSLRAALSERLRSPRPYPQDRFDGRGIVICAGGPRYFVCAFVLISLLRRTYRIDLPIQVWHLGRGELSEEMQALLEELQVEVIDAEVVIARNPARIAGGWPLKPYTIQQSRFREVLYLDSDIVPLIDPAGFFDWELYRHNGILMWPDIVDLKASNPIWRDLGLEPRDCTSVEAGALLVDKERAWPLLDVAVLLNEHVEEIYQAIYGDKDTFLLSALLVGREPTLLPHRPFVFDVDLVQRDPAGEPAFQHRTGSKWSLTDSNRPVAIASLMQPCEDALAELRRCWSGVVFNAPARSPRAMEEEARLLDTRFFHYEPAGSDGRKVELLPAGRVGEGRGVYEQHWAVIERDGTLVLQFYSATRLGVELTWREDGAWQGRSMTPTAFTARLTEAPAHATWPHAGSQRVATSAALWVSTLIAPTLFGAGFDAGRLTELRAALSLINDCFDDVPEQVKARCAAIPLPKYWHDALSEIAAGLAERRDSRMARIARTPYPQVIDPSGYERVP
jgi:hypothetical protein